MNFKNENDNFNRPNCLLKLATKDEWVMYRNLVYLL